MVISMAACSRYGQSSSTIYLVRLGDLGSLVEFTILDDTERIDPEVSLTYKGRNIQSVFYSVRESFNLQAVWPHELLEILVQQPKLEISVPNI